MYCSSCGSAIAQDLSYCNRCGAKISGAKAGGASKPTDPTESLVGAMAAVFVVGLGAIIGLMTVMKKVVGFDLGTILAITALSFVLMFLIEGVLIRQLSHTRKGSGRAGGDERQKGQTTRELVGAQPPALPEPVPSVTEHTTSAFEPDYAERQSK